MNDYKSTEKSIIIDDLKFTRDDKTGYYRNSKTRKRLHQYIYEKYYGPIPEGYHVHHKDHDKSNNDPYNLGLLKAEKHVTLHGIQKSSDPKWRQWARKNLQQNAIPKASAWHKSEEGREWHRNHWGTTLGQKKEVQFICEYCKADFLSKPSGKNRFCSNKCKSAWRRKAGLDNETRICKYCGTDFITNKYSKQKYCSKTCSSKSSSKLLQVCEN